MTISDIAKMAGVSSAAVSRYMNGGSLSEEKRAVIREVIEKTGYAPDIAAQTLRTGRVNQIGVIVPKINSVAISQIASGIAGELDESRYMMLLGNTGGTAQKELDYLESMQRSRVAGIIMMSAGVTQAHLRAFKKCRVPLVILAQHVPEMPCVCHDGRGATRALTERMLAHGRRRIAFIGVPDANVSDGYERRMGVQEALQAAGQPPEEMLVRTGRFDPESGRRCMKELLEACPELDGVVCASDTIAAGAYQALREAGRSVPEQVSLAGIGDSWISRMLEPKLTSVHLYQSEMGAEAARMLLQMIERTPEREGPVRQLTLGFTVAEGGSI